MNACKMLVVLPRNASLDHLAAARLLMLSNNQSYILKSGRMHQNTWHFARKLCWFKPLSIQQVAWKEIDEIHLLEVTHTRHIPELTGLLSATKASVVCHSHELPRLPFKFRYLPVKALSLTAQFIMNLSEKATSQSSDDQALFASAIAERTWLGLSSKATGIDFNAWHLMRSAIATPRQIGNSIILGMREGQRGLLRDLLRSGMEHQIANRIVSLSVVKSPGSVQDLEPIMDTLWSHLDPWLLVAAVVSGNRTNVWCRSRYPDIEPATCLRNESNRKGTEEGNTDFPTAARWATTNCRWACFTLNESDETKALKKLLEWLEVFLKPEPSASDIMSVSPKCVQWDETVANALDIMLRFNIMTLIVTQNDSYAGIISRSDLDRAVQMDIWDGCLGQFLSTAVPALDPDVPSRAIPGIMLQYNVTSLAVAKNGQVIGIISMREILRNLKDPIPLPGKYSHAPTDGNPPGQSQIESLIKRIMPLNVLHLLKKIGEHASEIGIQAFAVGGFVRDLMLEHPNFDVDIVIIGDALPFAVKLRTLLNAELRIFERFHTARLSIGKLKIDFSSARIEHYAQPGALPLVEFSGISNDLFRRDFTINTLALDLSPINFLTLLDFFGGYRDLSDKKIRILHSFSFLEDPTRLFRALRFAARFRFEIGQDTKHAFTLAVQRDAASRLSVKRISAEIDRCIQEANPHIILHSIFTSGLLKCLHPQLGLLTQLPPRFNLIPGILRRIRPLVGPVDTEAVYWTGLLSTLPFEDATELLSRMGFPSLRQKIILNALKSLASTPKELARLSLDNSVAIHSALSELFVETLVALSVFVLDKSGTRKVLRYITELRNIRCETTAKDLIAIGIPPGPHIRLILADIISKKVSGEIKTKKDEIEHASRFFKNICI